MLVNLTALLLDCVFNLRKKVIFAQFRCTSSGTYGLLPVRILSFMPQLQYYSPPPPTGRTSEKSSFSQTGTVANAHNPYT